MAANHPLRLTRATRTRENAERDWRAAILAAHRDGLSSRRIGEAVGLTHTRIQTIVREALCEQIVRERDDEGLAWKVIGNRHGMAGFQLRYAYNKGREAREKSRHAR